MTAKSESFLHGTEVARETVGEGVTRQILGYDDSIMMVKVWFEKGAEGPLHAHFHSQVTYVESGEFTVTVGDESRTLRAGDCMYISPHADHGAVCEEAGVLIDVFSPAREDFLEGESGYEA